MTQFFVGAVFSTCRATSSLVTVLFVDAAEASGMMASGAAAATVAKTAVDRLNSRLNRPLTPRLSGFVFLNRIVIPPINPGKYRRLESSVSKFSH
jgi:hypothetical protein